MKPQDTNDLEPAAAGAAELEAVESAEPYLEDGPEPGSSEAPSKAAEIADMAESLKALLLVGFEMIARRRGDRWRISDFEAAGMAEPLAEILDKNGLGLETPEARLAVAAGVVVVPRLIADSMEGSELAQDNEQAG